MEALEVHIVVAVFLPYILPYELGKSVKADSFAERMFEFHTA